MPIWGLRAFGGLGLTSCPRCASGSPCGSEQGLGWVTRVAQSSVSLPPKWPHPTPFPPGNQGPCVTGGLSSSEKRFSSALGFGARIPPKFEVGEWGPGPATSLCVPPRQRPS